MKKILLILLLVGSMAGMGLAQTKPATKKAHDPKVWEAKIVEFEKKDQEKTPPDGGIVFVGSSSIVYWDLDKAFPELHALNRGFGGSFASDSVYYEDRVVLKYHPRIVVFLAGENDLASGKSVADVKDAYEQFEKKLHEADPKTKLVIVGFKPTTKRANLWPKEKELNAWLETFEKDHPNTHVVDVAKEMLGEDGKARADLLRPDGIHPNAECYAIWNRLIKPYLVDGQ